MVQTELAVLLLKVPPPQLAAFQVESLQDAGARERPHPGSVGDRGWRRPVALPGLLVAPAQGPLPEDLPGEPLDAPELEVRAVGHAQVDAVAGDDRGGGASSGKGELPGDVLQGDPTQGQAALGARAVEGGAAPLRPVGPGHGGRGEGPGKGGGARGWGPGLPLPPG